jgi:hypothetical protein
MSYVERTDTHLWDVVRVVTRSVKQLAKALKLLVSRIFAIALVPHIDACIRFNRMTTLQRQEQLRCSPTIT